ncbi:MAG: nucleoside triphosphate pyrophosphohydrolase [Desulfovibrionaceae bacterium]|nr:nucleoside triphosphate pyrophosphohydrolase [Desulfovibrionaceae bacterium]MBF0512611.1 nucleoside triphosphate pyrophosphohydrolase [Desulfovibrionaceae bacterium]
MKRENRHDLEAIMDVLNALIGPEGCPWDKEQTPASLCDYVVEETFELTEAIREGDVPGVREELGDVLFLLCFLIRLYEGDGSIEYREIVGELAEKMIRRHPHVFENAANPDRAAIWSNWEKIKKREKKSYSVLGGIPKGLPPLLKAYRIHAKAARAGFAGQEAPEALDRLRGRFEQFERAATSGALGDGAGQKELFGEYLFALVGLGRSLGIKCEEALETANAAFIRRFAALEKKLGQDGRELHAVPASEQDALWKECKKE